MAILTTFVVLVHLLANSTCSGFLFSSFNSEGGSDDEEETVPNAYIVGFKKNLWRSDGGDNTAASIEEKVQEWLIPGDSSTETKSFQRFITKIFDHPLLFDGVALRDVSSDALERIRQDPSVSFVEPEYVHRVQIIDEEKGFQPEAIETFEADYSDSSTTTTSSLNTTIQRLPLSKSQWGLDRIDQYSLPIDNQYEYAYSGKGVEVYVLDTGVRATHQEFRHSDGTPGSRVSCFKRFVLNQRLWCEDEYGHGTHVAGTVAGLTYGVAKDASIINVKVLDGSGTGTTSSILTGMLYVVRRKLLSPRTPMVANMSFGRGSRSNAFNMGANAMMAAGVFVASSAGNSSRNACGFSPTGSLGAVTVGATTRSDDRAAFSNFGICVSIYAPGSEILSAAAVTDSTIAYLSGTSMSSPHVAGAAALYLEKYPRWRPWRVLRAMRNTAVKGQLGDVYLGEDRLLNIHALNMGLDFSCQAPGRTCESPSDCCSGVCTERLREFRCS